MREACTFPAQCFNCKEEGHQEHDCPLLPTIGCWVGKRGRSPGRAPRREHGARRHRASASRALGLYWLSAVGATGVSASDAGA